MPPQVDDEKLQLDEEAPDKLTLDEPASGGEEQKTEPPPEGVSELQKRRAGQSTWGKIKTALNPFSVSEDLGALGTSLGRRAEQAHMEDLGAAARGEKPSGYKSQLEDLGARAAQKGAGLVSPQSAGITAGFLAAPEVVGPALAVHGASQMWDPAKKLYQNWTSENPDKLGGGLSPEEMDQLLSGGSEAVGGAAGTGEALRGGAMNTTTGRLADKAIRGTPLTDVGRVDAAVKQIMEVKPPGMNDIEYANRVHAAVRDMQDIAARNAGKIKAPRDARNAINTRIGEIEAPIHAQLASLTGPQDMIPEATWRPAVEQHVDAAIQKQVTSGHLSPTEALKAKQNVMEWFGSGDKTAEMLEGHRVRMNTEAEKYYGADTAGKHTIDTSDATAIGQRAAGDGLRDVLYGDTTNPGILEKKGLTATDENGNPVAIRDVRKRVGNLLEIRDHFEDAINKSERTGDWSAFGAMAKGPSLAAGGVGALWGLMSGHLGLGIGLGEAAKAVGDYKSSKNVNLNTQKAFRNLGTTAPKTMVPPINVEARPPNPPQYAQPAGPVNIPAQFPQPAGPVNIPAQYPQPAGPANIPAQFPQPQGPRVSAAPPPVEPRFATEATGTVEDISRLGARGAGGVRVTPKGELPAPGTTIGNIEPGAAPEAAKPTRLGNINGGKQIWRITGFQPETGIEIDLGAVEGKTREEAIQKSQALGNPDLVRDAAPLKGKAILGGEPEVKHMVKPTETEETRAETQKKSPTEIENLTPREALREGDTFVDEKGEPRRITEITEDGTIKTADGTLRNYPEGEIRHLGDINSSRAQLARGGMFHPAEEVKPLKKPGFNELRATDLTKDVEGEGGRTKVADIGKMIGKFAKEKVGKIKPDEEVANAIKQAAPEIKYQMATDNSGLGWYDKDTQKAVDAMTELHPELKDPKKASFFKTFWSALSYGKNPADNMMLAERAYQLYKETGKMPITQPDGKAWGVYKAGHEGNLKTTQALVDKYGEGGAVDWLLAKHPTSELKQFNKNVAGKADEQQYGAVVYGPKGGNFYLNLNGVPDLVTVDKWMARTWRRWSGQLSAKNVDEAPSPAEIRGAREAVAKVAEKLKLEPRDAQAVLWYYEQELYKAHGATSEALSYGNEARRIVDQRKTVQPEGNAGKGGGAQIFKKAAKY